MAAPGDNMEEEMMNIINDRTQFITNLGEQDVDDGSQYLALENEQENVLQENTGEVYIVNIYYM
jgi:Uri superfamily endonuclease